MSKWESKEAVGIKLELRWMKYVNLCVVDLSFIKFSLLFIFLFVIHQHIFHSCSYWIQITITIVLKEATTKKTSNCKEEFTFYSHHNTSDIDVENLWIPPCWVVYSLPFKAYFANFWGMLKIYDNWNKNLFTIFSTKDTFR
jgi:hypothetical protein